MNSITIRYIDLLKYSSYLLKLLGFLGLILFNLIEVNINIINTNYNKDLRSNKYSYIK